MHASTSRGIPSDPAIPPGARSGCGFIRATAPFVNWHPRLLTCACIELQLQRELDVVCVRTVHVVLEGVVQDRELSDLLGTSTRLQVQRDDPWTNVSRTPEMPVAHQYVNILANT